MYQIQLTKPCTAYFIGIGGISMSGLAEILLEENFRISGSDAKSSPLTRTLEERGAVIYYGQRASNIKDDVDTPPLFIRTIPNFAPPKKWDFL